MTVVVGARREAALAALCDGIRRDGGRAEYLVTDLQDEAAVERLVAAAEALGPLDALVNNGALGILREIADGRSDEWRAMLETNVLGTLCACRAALRGMLPRGRGDIVTMTSASIHGGWPFLSVYQSTKAALAALMQGLRAEVADRGVRVMTVEMHQVGGTDFATSFAPELLPIALQRWIELSLVRPGAAVLDPADVARAVRFQLSQPDPVSIHDLVIRPRAC